MLREKCSSLGIFQEIFEMFVVIFPLNEWMTGTACRFALFHFHHLGTALIVVKIMYGILF